MPCVMELDSNSLELTCVTQTRTASAIHSPNPVYVAAWIQTEGKGHAIIWIGEVYREELLNY